MLEGNSAQKIHDRLAPVYGDDALFQSTVSKWVREFRLVGRPCLDDIDGAIVQKLNKHPFHSCRSLAEEVGVAPSTVSKHLTESRRFPRRCLYWVPHELTDALSEKRVMIGNQLLEILEEAQSTGFVNLLLETSPGFSYHMHLVLHGPCHRMKCRQGRSQIFQLQTFAFLFPRREK
jgi:hypothetical protein